MYLMSDSELRSWAYNANDFKSVGQDFELTVADLDRSDIVLELASDNDCPQQLFFLRCAVQIIGIELRDSSEPLTRRFQLEAYIRRAEKTGNPYLLEFVWRARALLDDPSLYDENLWYQGHLADEIYSA